MPQIEGTSRHQIQIFALEQAIAADNPVRVIDAFVSTLSLEELGFQIKGKEDEGRPAYSAEMLLRLYLYGYLNRMRSSRQLEKACRRNIELWWLLNKQCRGQCGTSEGQEEYRRRQAIVEHPFGTIKRGWGYSYTLLKGKEKVSGEFALTFTSYNLRRVLTIIGPKALLERLERLFFGFLQLRAARVRLSALKNGWLYSTPGCSRAA